MPVTSDALLGIMFQNKTRAPDLDRAGSTQTMKFTAQCSDQFFRRVHFIEDTNYTEQLNATCCPTLDVRLHAPILEHLCPFSASVSFVFFNIHRSSFVQGLVLRQQRVAFEERHAELNLYQSP